MRDPITIEGNITSDIRFHTFPDGQQVANFTVASNSSAQNKQTNEWEDKGAGFFDCTVPNRLVPAVQNNMQKGTPVIVSGTLDFRAYETRDGAKGTAMEIRVEKLGYSLRHHDVQGGRRQRGGAPQQQGSAASYYGQPQQQPQQQYQQQQQGPVAQQAWGQPAVQQQPATQQQDNAWGQQQQSQGSWGGFDDEKPF